MPKGKGYSYDMKDRKSMGKGMKDFDDGYGIGKREGMQILGKEGVMGHEKEPYDVNAFKAQKRDMSRMDVSSMDYRGTPDQAFHYKY